MKKFKMCIRDRACTEVERKHCQQCPQKGGGADGDQPRQSNDDADDVADGPGPQVDVYKRQVIRMIRFVLSFIDFPPFSDLSLDWTIPHLSA